VLAATKARRSGRIRQHENKQIADVERRVPTAAAAALHGGANVICSVVVHQMSLETWLNK